MAKIRVEMHLTEETVAKLDLLAAQSGRSRKNFCETQIQSLLAAKPQVQDLTKSNVSVEPPKQATSNYAINSDDTKKGAINQRIAELRAELKNPPKNPQLGLKIWKKLRENELAKLEVEALK